MATKKKIELSKEVLQHLRNAQFKPEAPVYEPFEVLVTIPSGDYEVNSKLVPASGEMKSWTAYEAVFVINKEQFIMRYRSGVTPDEDADMTITLFKANRDFTTTSGKLIKKGDTKPFAINADAGE